jgi:DNA replication protein DnaC
MSVSADVCPLCEGTGWKRMGATAESRVVRCDCQLKSRAEKLLAAARIPKRYEHCELSEFDTHFGGAHPSLQKALLSAQAFVGNYPVDDTGLLLTGPVGVGKTHLAVGIMKELIRAKQISCVFYEYRELLKEIQNSYNSTVQATELGLLQPVFETEVLVIDELGSMKSSEWVEDTVGFILNTRYNKQKTLIVTTNLEDLPAAAALKPGEDLDMFKVKRAARQESLGDRIGERMRSRLHEMCRIINLTGLDVRMKFRSASFR